MTLLLRKFRRQRMLQHARSFLACSLIFTVGGMQPLMAQVAAVAQSAGATPMALHITILQGEDALNNIRERTAREPIVQVEDENHRPVVGAVVLFGVNSGDTGAGGTFGAATSFSTVTDAEGKAYGTGFKPNKNTGKYTIAVTVTVAALLATVLIHQSNVAGAAGAGGSDAGVAGQTPADITPTNGKPPYAGHHVSRWLIVGGAALIAGAVIAGVLLSGGGGHSATITPGTGTVSH